LPGVAQLYRRLAAFPTIRRDAHPIPFVQAQIDGDAAYP
jgi:hypothetical protein